MEASISRLPTQSALTIGIILGAAGVLALYLLRRRSIAQPDSPPPSSSRKSSRGAAGHAGNMEEDGFFFKKETHRFDNERRILERLRDCNDPMAGCAPEFHGVVEMEDDDGTSRYIKMRSLLEGFDEASVCQMDVKMGVRCFAEKELSATDPRPDLFKKLLKLGLPLTRSLLTAEELETKAITKARWMTIRDSTSSTKSLGFRVDGVVTPSHKTKPLELATVRTEAQVAAALSSFLPPSRRRQTAEAVLARLAEIERCLRASELFATSECIGSSLLFAADAHGHVGIWMLDFGITCDAPVPGGRLRHDVPWEVGNHEDGYLTGLTNLQHVWKQVLDSL